MKNICDIYSNEVRKKLIVSKTQKRLLLRQLSQSLQDFEEEHGGEVGLEDIEARFGSSTELAEILLHQSGTAELKRTINKKRTATWIIIAVCIISLLIGIFYIAYDHKRKEAFISGYEAETQVYDENEIPEHIENPPKNTRTYYGNIGG